MANTLLILHLLGVIAWLGGSLTTGLIWARAASAPEPELEVATRNLQWMSRWIAMPSSVIVLLAGGALVSVANWDFSQGWIHVGTAMLVGAALVGVGLVAPATRSLLASLQTGAADRAALARTRAGLLIAWTMLLVAVWAMVAKPF